MLLSKDRAKNKKLLGIVLEKALSQSKSCGMSYICLNGQSTLRGLSPVLGPDFLPYCTGLFMHVFFNSSLPVSDWAHVLDLKEFMLP